MDTYFPFYLWYRLLPQLTMTLNMLRQLQLNPELSALKKVDGVHNFELTPLAPMGCKVQMNEKPHQKRTYAPHSVGVWYLGSSVNNYRWYTFYNIDTGRENTPDTIAFSPEFMKMPKCSSRDMAILAATDMEKSLQTPIPESHFQVGDSQIKSIK